MIVSQEFRSEYLFKFWSCRLVAGNVLCWSCTGSHEPRRASDATEVWKVSGCFFFFRLWWRILILACLKIYILLSISHKLSVNTIYIYCLATWRRPGLSNALCLVNEFYPLIVADIHGTVLWSSVPKLSSRVFRYMTLRKPQAQATRGPVWCTSSISRGKIRVGRAPELKIMFWCWLPAIVTWY